MAAAAGAPESEPAVGGEVKSTSSLGLLLLIMMGGGSLRPRRLLLFSVVEGCARRGGQWDRNGRVLFAVGVVNDLSAAGFTSFWAVFLLGSHTVWLHVVLGCFVSMQVFF